MIIIINYIKILVSYSSLDSEIISSFEIKMKMLIVLSVG